MTTCFDVIESKFDYLQIIQFSEDAELIGSIAKLGETVSGLAAKVDDKQKQIERAKQTALVGATLAKLDKAIGNIQNKLDVSASQAAAMAGAIGGLSGAGAGGAGGAAGGGAGAGGAFGGGGGGADAGGGGAQTTCVEGQPARLDIKISV